MEKINLKIKTKNRQLFFLFLFSGVAMLCLFLSPSLLSISILGISFIAVAISINCNSEVFSKASNRVDIIGSIILTLLIEIFGYYFFYTNWLKSSRVTSIAEKLNITKTMLIMIVGILGVVVGLYAVWILSRWIILKLRFLFKKLPEQRINIIAKRLLINCLFPISAVAFFSLNATKDIDYITGIAVSFILSSIISTQLQPIWGYFKESNIIIRILSFLSAFGICLLGKDSFYKYWGTSSKLKSIESKFAFSFDLVKVISVIGLIAALMFVYVCLYLFLQKMVQIINETLIFKGLTSAEIILYTVLFLGLIILITILFSLTDAFYGTKYNYDIIYTSDSPSLVKGNVFLALTHPENDLRQPLFALFAAPFAGIPYLISRFFQSSAAIHAILLNFTQVMMLFIANFILAKMLRLNSVKRICFMIITLFTYSQMLFSMMMEQYVVAYFWLILCAYLICENRKKSRIALWGAGGTMLTSLIIVPFQSEHSPFKNFKEWFWDMVKYGMEFVTLMLVFCRFDVIFNFSTKISQLSGFTGKSYTMMEKLYQYTAFILNCFIAPSTRIDNTTYNHLSWQLNYNTSLNLIGIAIFVLCIISAWMNRDKKSSLFAIGWIGFSVVVLLLLGWGIQENGLVLYALYFGWAFLVLIFQLIEKIETKMKTGILIPIFTVLAVTVMSVINIPSIIEMIKFAIKNYPV